MTEQQLIVQNPRELTANELNQVNGGASDVFFFTGPVRSGPVFTPTGKITGSTSNGNGGVENTGTPKENGTTNVINHFTLSH